MEQNITEQEEYQEIDIRCINKYAVSISVISEMLGVNERIVLIWFGVGNCNSLHILKGNKTLLSLWVSVRSRCSNSGAYPRYKMIGFYLSKAEMLLLWYRDNASAMVKPIFRRIDSFGNFEYKNCRFVDKFSLGSLG